MNVLTTKNLSYGDLFMLDGDESKTWQAIESIEGKDILWLSDTSRAVHVSELIPIYLEPSKAVWQWVKEEKKRLDFSVKIGTAYSQVLFNSPGISICIRITHLHQLQAATRFVLEHSMKNEESPIL